MKKCVLLLPTTYNDGSEVPPTVVSGILGQIDEAFDGHTVDGLCDGTYRMADGSFAHDRPLKVWVVVAPERVEELRAIAEDVAGLLKQESLYFEVTNIEFDFVRPRPGKGAQS